MLILTNRNWLTIVKYCKRGNLRVTECTGSMLFAKRYDASAIVYQYHYRKVYLFEANNDSQGHWSGILIHLIDKLLYGYEKNTRVHICLFLFVTSLTIDYTCSLVYTCHLRVFEDKKDLEILRLQSPAFLQESSHYI